MRGNIIGVWSETWREIWLPLIEQEDVPEDIFCELYSELAKFLKLPTGDRAFELILKDAQLLKETIDRALILSRQNIDLERREAIFQTVISEDPSQWQLRKQILKDALATLLTDDATSVELLATALSEIASDLKKLENAHERMLEAIINNKEECRLAFELTTTDQLIGEKSLIKFLESAHEILDDIGGDKLSNYYFSLLEDFIKKFSLGYDLRRPCQLCPSVSGVFAGLFRELRAVASTDAHLDTLMGDFEGAFRDLRTDSSDGKIKTCIQKQVNLLEALGGKCPGVTAGELGKICNQLKSWPHTAVKTSLSSLYGFTSDYPGIRHGGNVAGVLRNIELRDMVAMTVLLTGFSPYLTDQFNAEKVYRGE